MTYTDAIAALEKSGKTFEFPVRWGMDLQSEHERWLTEEHVKAPVVVMNYPKEIKAFYMRMNDDGKTVAAMDVLAPGIGEIIGGSQREERLDYLDRRLAELHLDPKAYWWYRDLRRYGTVPHAGFGLGLERTIIYATGHGQYPGRHSVSAHAGTRGLLNADSQSDSERHERFSSRSRALAQRLQHVDRIAGVCHLEHQHAVVADLLRFHHRGVPVDACRRTAAGGRRAVPRCRGRASSTGGRTASRSPRRHRPSGGRDRSRGRCRRRGPRVFFDQRGKRRGVGERVRDHFDGDAHVHARAAAVAISSTLRRAASG